MTQKKARPAYVNSEKVKECLDEIDDCISNIRVDARNLGKVPAEIYFSLDNVLGLLVSIEEDVANVYDEFLANKSFVRKEG